MALQLIRQMLAGGKEHIIKGSLVVDEASGKNFEQLVLETTALDSSVEALKNTLNDFLTGEDDGGNIDRLVELVREIAANKASIDALVADKVAKADIVNALTSVDETRVLSAAQGKALKDLLDALDAKVTESGHSHANADVLDKLATDKDGNLTCNGHVLDGATGLAFVSDAEDSPVFDGKLVLVASPYEMPVAAEA